MWLLVAFISPWLKDYLNCSLFDTLLRRVLYKTRGNCPGDRYVSLNGRLTFWIGTGKYNCVVSAQMKRIVSSVTALCDACLLRILQWWSYQKFRERFEGVRDYQGPEEKSWWSNGYRARHASYEAMNAFKRVALKKYGILNMEIGNFVAMQWLSFAMYPTDLSPSTYL